MRGHYSTKLDVFSFGVLVLEIVTGRRNSFAANSEHSQDLFGLVSTIISTSILRCSLHFLWLAESELLAGVEALGGGNDRRASRPRIGQALPQRGDSEMHQHWAAVCPAEPHGPAIHVVDRRHARQRHCLSRSSLQASLCLRQEQELLRDY